MIDFDTWWNSAAADEFRAQHEDMDGNAVLPVWEAAVFAAIPFARPVQRPVAQLVRTKMAVSEDEFDVRVFDKSLPNNCYLYAAPQPVAAPIVPSEQIDMVDLQDELWRAHAEKVLSDVKQISSEDNFYEPFKSGFDTAIEEIEHRLLTTASNAGEAAQGDKS